MNGVGIRFCFVLLNWWMKYVSLQFLRSKINKLERELSPAIKTNAEQFQSDSCLILAMNI